MKQYIDVVKDILENGHVHEDRTGVGRKSIYGVMLKFKHEDGFPLCTTRKIPYKNMIKETLWFLTGSTKASECGSAIWDQWAVKDSDVEAFIEKHKEKLISLGYDVDSLKGFLLDFSKGSIGGMYGHNWRNAPALLGGTEPFFPQVKHEDIASDKLENYKKDYIQYVETTTSDEVLTLDDYIEARHYSSIDQIQNLLINLRDRPYSSRHIVTAWIPNFVPFEFLSPEENVLLGKGALAACHMQFQCFVRNDKTGNKVLDLMVLVRKH